MNKTANLLQAVWARFRENGVTAVLLRNHTVDVIREKGDIDVLVEPDQCSLAAEIIRGVTRERGWRQLFCETVSNHLHLLFWKYEGKGIEALHVDLQSALGRKGFRYAPAQPFLACKQDYNGVDIPSKPAGAAALLLHVLMDKGALPARYRNDLENAADEKLETVLLQVLSRHAVSRIMSWVDCGMPERELPSLRKALRRALACRDPGNLVRPAWVRWRRRLRYFGKRRGILIAFVGPDGSGKTTTLSGVKELIPSGPYPVSTVYMGKRDPFLPTSHIIRWFWRKRSTQGTGGNFGRKGARSLRGRLIDALGLMNWIVDQWGRYAFSIRPRLQQEGMVLTDRYSFDLANRKKGSLAFHPVFLRSLRFLFPVPDRTVLLSNSPEILSERNGETTVAESAEMLERFRLILRHVPHSMEVRTDLPEQEIVARIACEIATLRQDKCL